MSHQHQVNSILAWITVLSSGLFFFFSFINMNSFDALNHAISIEFSLDAFQISTLETLYFIANILFLIPAGLILDRFSTRKTLLIGFLVMILATLLFSMAQTYWLLAACRFIIGAASTLSLLSAMRLTSRWFENKYNGLVLSIVITLAMIGGMLAQQLSKLSSIFGSWHHTLLALAILGGTFWILNFIFVKDSPSQARKTETQLRQKLKNTGFWQSFGQAACNIQNWIAGIYGNILSIPIVVLGALWGQEYLVGAKGISHAKAADIISLIFFGMIIGSPVMGYISDKLRRRKVPMIIGATLSCAVTLVIYSTHSPNTIYLAILFFLLGLFTSSQVLSYAYFIEANPRHITTTSAGLGTTIIMSCGFVFGLLFGWITNQHHKIIDGHSVYSATNYNHAFLILPFTFAIAIILACLIKETHCQFRV